MWRWGPHWSSAAPCPTRSTWWPAAIVPEAVVWLSLLNAVFTTFAPVLMVMMAIERIGAPLAAQCGMVGPMSTIVLGVWLLGEPFTGWVIVGTLLVLAGVWLLAKWRT
jgi:drug/metabolite transporter (DMT)-like permease